VAYERNKKYVKAEEIFLRIIKENPRHASALNYLGYMWADQGIRLSESLDYIQKAVTLDPNNGAYLDSLGWVYFRLNKLGEAEKYLLTAARRVKNDPTIHDHLGDLYYRLGRYTKAEESWRQALVHTTESEEVQRVQKKLKQLKNQENKKP
jgi:tetratricopeptide (TPR) repeat protein